MSEMPIEPINNQQENTEGNLNLLAPALISEKRGELEAARKEYFAAAELVQQRQKEVNEAWETFGKDVAHKNSLVEIRDNLNLELREKRKEIRQIELDLKSASEELEELEQLATNVRKEVPKADRTVTQAYQDHESAKNRLLEAGESLELIAQKVKDAEATFLAVGGTLPKRETIMLKEPNERNRQSPWVSGSFYIVAVIVLMTVIAVISTNVPWYVLVVVIIGGLIAIAIVGALQLRHDEALSEDNFIDLMEKSLRRLPLLRGNDNPEQKVEDSQPDGDSETK